MEECERVFGLWHRMLISAAVPTVPLIGKEKRVDRGCCHKGEMFVIRLERRGFFFFVVSSSIKV